MVYLCRVKLFPESISVDKWWRHCSAVEEILDNGVSTTFNHPSGTVCRELDAAPAPAATPDIVYAMMNGHWTRR